MNPRRLRLQAAIVVMLALTSSPVRAQVKNIDLATVEVKGVAGKGPTSAAAYERALESAVERAALELFVQTESERGRYQSARPAIMTRYREFVRSHQMVDKYDEAGENVIEVDALIDRPRLKGALERLGVITDIVNSAAAAERPRVLAYLADGSAGPLSEFAVGRINDYLTRHAVEVVDRATIERLVHEDAAITRAGSTAARRLALRSQASVYLLVSADIRATRRFGPNQLHQAAIRIEAWDAGGRGAFDASDYRSRELTFEAGADLDKSRRAAVEEAVGGAMEALSVKIFKVWKEAAERGSLYRVVVRGASEAQQDRVKSAIGALASLESIEPPSGGDVAYLIRCREPLESVVEKLMAQQGVSGGLDVAEESITEIVLRSKGPR